MIAIFFILFLFLLIASALFSGLETGFLVLKRHEEAIRDREELKGVIKFLDNIEDLMIMILIGNNISIVAASSLMSDIFIRRFGDIGILYGSIIETILFLIFGEIVPKNAFLKNPIGFVPKFVWFIRIVHIVLFPFIVLFSVFKRFFRKAERDFYESIEKKEAIDIVEDIARAINGWEPESPEYKEIKFFLTELLELKTLRANQVMVPTYLIQSVEIKSPIEEVVKLIGKTRFSYIPVYENRVDNIIGYIYSRELLKKLKEKSKKREIKDYLREPYYVPENKIVYEIFEEMIKSNLHIVFVVDEVGATTGMITLDDIVEEVIGEIKKKLSGYFVKEDLISQAGDGSFLIRGDADIEYVEKETGLNIPDGPYETMAGYIYHIYKGIPKKGEKIELDDGRYLEILKANPRGVQLVKLVRFSENGE